MPTTPLALSLLVFVGGGVGAVLRFWAGEVVRPFEWKFPWATFGINVVGSFVLGVVASAFAAEEKAWWRALLGAGVCGGFTTFSTFSVETLKLIDEERWAAAGGYAVGSVLAAVVGAWAGGRLVRG